MHESLDPFADIDGRVQSIAIIISYHTTRIIKTRFIDNKSQVTK